ncbi:hypothetical protein AB0K12_10855 [Nonomuraea sp. NPDC049419]|uniref:hypothetical protein n=1 Tax=Nonomuraea sp. NPDC049419 TaxID=3155772 RepID=UPI003435CE89
MESVSVTDDGHGMPIASCAGFFGGLGGSWKTTAKLSPHLKRGLHGRSGQGRLRAFALGEQVRWVTVAEAADGRIERTVITGAVDRPADFDISDAEQVDGPSSTRVEASVPVDFVNLAPSPGRDPEQEDHAAAAERDHLARPQRAVRGAETAPAGAGPCPRPGRA